MVLYTAMSDEIGLKKYVRARVYLFACLLITHVSARMSFIDNNMMYN